MANLGPTDASAAKIEPGLVEATVAAPSQGRLLSSEESGGCAPGDAADASDDSGNNGKHFPGQEDTRPVVVQEPGAYDTDLPNKPKMGDPAIIEQTTAKIQEEEQVQCSEKCALKNPMIDDTAFIQVSLLGNGKCDGDGNGTERNRKPEETKEIKEKKPKRRGGRARKNKDFLNFTPNEKNEKRLQYSRKEMEALRFQELEDQKKKWVEVYCGLGQQVAQEYDGLAELANIHQKHGVPSFDFDPRPQFLKSANLDCLKFADNQAENLNTSDPASSPPYIDEIDCSVVEGECSQDDDSDEDYSSIQRPAFLVKGEPDFDSGPPQDGLEYLRRVRWEAARIPKVTVAKVNIIKEQSSYMPQVPDIMMCPEHLLPLKQWEDSFLDDFSELRLAFMRIDLQGSGEENSIILQSVQVEDILVQMLESASFEKFDITSKDDSSSSEASCKLEANDTKVDPHSSQKHSIISDPPTLSMISKMDSAARISMLKRRISSIEKMNRLPLNDGLWLFALCAAVDCPLDADTSAALRSLLRKCASLRAAKTEVDDEVIILNILVTISGKYFGQLEK